jgi:hypothetical protein
MALRDFLIAPREGDGEAESAGASRGGAAAGAGALGHGAAPAGRNRAARRLRLPRPARVRPTADVGVSVGLLACARDVRALAVAAGTIVARRHHAALVCVCGQGDEPGVAFRAPPRTEAARLAASLRARGLEADARGKVALVDAARTDDSAAVAARALAAAGPLPTILAVAARDVDVDVLLAAQDAIVVALPPSTEPALVELTTTSARELAADVAGVVVALDPASRALALAGLRAPTSLREAVQALIAPAAVGRAP